uniref:(northern house mosquito) hypothetical protein n=1 Tax=Culex pipiens TaxID=7175 RepID=A0A8D8CZB7_CULPI
MQASSSGQRCSHSVSRGYSPNSTSVSLAVKLVCRSSCWISDALVRWISSHENAMLPGSLWIGSSTMLTGLSMLRNGCELNQSSEKMCSAEDLLDEDDGQITRTTFSGLPL